MKTKKSTECARVREALAEGRRGQVEEAHLFVCSACRTEARLAAAWASLKAAEPREVVTPADPAFIRGVIEAVRADRDRRTKVKVRLAAAAALVFFFLVGASQRLTSATKTGGEESYAQLVSPDPDADLPE
jgi:predicted anti-sigma-YlaC factor YlaD